MAFRLPPYLQWRNGRPRWEPGPRLRKAFKGQDLKDDAGRWLGLDAAVAAANDLNANVAIWRAGGAPRRRPAKTRKIARTCHHLWEVWASPDDPEKAGLHWLKLAPHTRCDYASKIGIFLDTFGEEPVAALTKPALHDWWEILVKARGHAMANATIAVVRSMLSYAVLKGWITDNPAKQLRIIGVPPRVVTWTPAEASAFVAAADAAGLHGLADAVVLALHTGQRRGDILALEMPEIAGGRARIRQSKRGARVSVPFTDALRDRLDAIAARRRAGPVAELVLTGPLVRDKSGRPYTAKKFNADFGSIRAAVAKDIPTMACKQFLDLRDTAITRLAIAGCTVPEIRSITGHSMESITQVLKHYLAIDDRMADAAIARLRAWMQAEGIAV